MVRAAHRRRHPQVQHHRTVGRRLEAAAADYVEAHARRGDIDDVLSTIDRYAYEKSFLVNVGDEKGVLLDAAVRRSDPQLALELGTYCGYGALRIARAAPSARVFSVELSAANADVARRIWAHAGAGDRITCVVGTIGDGGRTLTRLAEHGFAAGAVDFVFIDHDKNAYSPICAPSSTATGCIPARSWSPIVLPRLPQVPGVHARTAGPALADRRTSHARRVPDADPRPRPESEYLG